MRRTARTSKILRRYATKILEDFGVSEPPVPVKEIAEWLGAEVRFTSFSDDEEISGMIIRSENEVIIGVNIKHHENRRRFTISHECGHFVLHKSKNLYIDKTFSVAFRGRNSSEATDPDEIEANRFAAELLMPYKLLSNDIFDDGVFGVSMDIESENKIRMLADRYEVSPQAMTFRLQNIFQDTY